MQKIKVLSLFSGIGAFEMGLKKANIPFELINYCEIDKYASKSYSLIHNVSEDLNLGDITKIDINKLPKDIDLITHGSPCQDFSIAGLQAGGNEDSGTRSSLMYETVKIIEQVKPKYVIWENVKNLLSDKHKHNFHKYLNKLDKLGYVNYYKVLNARKYGIPQNRERIFCISFRKDVDFNFEFPNEIPLKCKVKDFLEEDIVDDFYYSICPSMMKAFEKGRVKEIQDLDFITTITTRQVRSPNSGFVRDKKGLRYLTPKECLRFMGFNDDDINYDLLLSESSNNQLWKQAGNSIVVDVLKYIYLQMFNNNTNTIKEKQNKEFYKQTTIFDFIGD